MGSEFNSSQHMNKSLSRPKYSKERIAVANIEQAIDILSGSTDTAENESAKWLLTQLIILMNEYDENLELKNDLSTSK